MPRRHDDLFGNIASFSALLAAARRAVKGKRRKAGASSFIANLEREILRLERELLDGTYRPGRYVIIEIREALRRYLSIPTVDATPEEIVAIEYGRAANKRGDFVTLDALLKT